VRARLLGGADVRVAGARVPLADAARLEALVALLLLHRDAPQPRPQLAFRLWPDSTDAQALTNLRKLLHALRTRTPALDGCVEITPRTVRWATGQPTWLDVTAFEELLAVRGPGRGAALAEAVALYGGDLLEGRTDEWVLAERDRLRLRHLDALDELAGLHEAGGRLAEAVAVAERLRLADPLREETHRRLMRLHAARGDRARAVAAFHECSSVLERELGVPPAPATRAAYAALLSVAPPTAPAAATPPPFVGRAAERARLTAAWRAAEAGRAGCVLVTGEPGVGKTRLVDEFRAWCARRGAVVADARCYAAEGPLAYGPVVSWLRSPALAARLPRLEPHRLTELARLLPELLDDAPGLPRPEEVPGPEVAHRLFDAVASAVRAPGPAVLLVVDDAHHADAESSRLVHYLLRARPAARLLVVATARAEELDDEHPVRTLLAGLRGAGEAGVELELARLDRAETAALAERLTGAVLPGPDLDRLHAETEGNPLFVVEGVRAGWTAGAAPGPRVQAVIESRLLQLPDPVRELAETAALIGREFDVDVLAAAAEVDEDALVTGLDELWRRRIVRERGAHGHDFTHGRIREVAAGRVGPARRRLLHRRIAGVLERRPDAGHAGAAARIAAHHERAGAAGRAAQWYRRAAEALQPLHADAQAVALLERAVGRVAALPAGPDRDAAELAVRTALLPPLASVGGYASPAQSDAQERARVLTAQLRADPSPALLRARAMSACTVGDFAAARRIGAQLRAAGEDGGQDVLVVEGAFVLGIAAFWSAEFEAARGHLELAVRRHRPEERRTHLLHYGNDPEVSCLARLGNTLWFLGRPDEARRARAAALERADEIGHGCTRGIALLFSALLALDAGEEDRLRALTAELGEGQQSRQPQLCAAALAGHLAVLDGHAQAGVATVRAAAARDRGHDAPGLQACLQRVLLAAHLGAGDPGGAAAVADRLLAMGGGARVWAGEARRVRAAFPARTG
jgi:DNA-binding SARP family transcriptional activator